MTPARTPFLLFPLLLALSNGCSGPTTVEFGEPRTLRKEQRPLVWDAPADVRLDLDRMRGAADAHAQGKGAQGERGAQGGAMVWTGDTPAGWESQPAQPKRFRDAIWRITGQPDAEAYLTAAVGGGVRGNLQRWYTQQFGIADVPALESLPVAEIAGRPGRLAEIKGTFSGRDGSKPGWASLIAFAVKGEEMMTFRLTGPEAVVLGNKDKFLALAKSLRQATASPNPNAPPIEPGQPMPKGHPATGGATDPHGGNPHAGAGTGTPPQPAPGAAQFTATTPAGWTAKAGSTKALHHAFGKDGEVYVSQLGGTLKSSLDIWRGEMGAKSQLTDAQVQALPKIAFLGEDAVLLDLTGDMNGMVRQLKGARMLLAARVDGSTITFCKLAGPAAEVEAQVDAFRAFCGSVRRAQ